MIDNYLQEEEDDAGNIRHVAITDTGKRLTSPDGIIWTKPPEETE